MKTSDSRSAKDSEESNEVSKNLNEGKPHENLLQELLVELRALKISQAKQNSDIAQALKKANLQISDWKKSSSRFSLKKLLIKLISETPPIVIAVLLAFGINSWWQNLTNEKLSADSYRMIIQEARFNLGILEEIVNDDKKQLEKVEAFLEDIDSNEVDQDKDYSTGISLYPLKNVAMETLALSGNITNLDQDFLEEAAFLKSLVDSDDGYRTGILPIMATTLQGDVAEGLQRRKEILRDHIRNYGYYAERHREFLKKYDASNKPPK